MCSNIGLEHFRVFPKAVKSVDPLAQTNDLKESQRKITQHELGLELTKKKLGLERKVYLGLCRHCSEDCAAEAACAIKPCRTRGKPATAVPVLEP